MFHLIHERMAREETADRRREAQRERLGRCVEQAHREQVERVRASVLLVPRRPSDVSREA
jgi:hypothetical protein